MKVKEVIVVEGKADRLKVEQAVRADIIETNGLALSEQTINKIKHLAKKRGVIIFTDPDYAGERIRTMIQAQVPNCKHAFLPKSQAQSNKRQTNLGIEHATVEHIKQALSGIYEVFQEEAIPITKADLLTLGLIGTPQSKEKRKLLGERLNIGYPNGKQLLKRLTMFQISKQQLLDALVAIEGEEKNGQS